VYFEAIVDGIPKIISLADMDEKLKKALPSLINRNYKLQLHPIFKTCMLSPE